MNIDSILIACLETLERNPKLLEAVTEYIKARAFAESELAAWRRRRK